MGVSKRAKKASAKRKGPKTTRTATGARLPKPTSKAHTRKTRTSRRNKDPGSHAEEPAPKDQEKGHLQNFHLFPLLPQEIQLMIWAFWRSNQPIIRHYFALKGQCRAYAAFDTETMKFITAATTARSAEIASDDPLDPMEFKVRFTNRVETVDDMAKLEEAVSGCKPVSVRWNEARPPWPVLSPAFTWVNFEKDIFMLSSRYRFPGQLRFLFQKIGAISPPDIPGNHWARRIQHLGIRMSTQHDCPNELDARGLSQMVSLKRVYLILTSGLPLNYYLKRAGPGSLFYSGLKHDFGFVGFNPADHSKVDLRHPLGQAFLRCFEVTTLTAAYLRGYFEENGKQGVDIQIVIDKFLDI